MSTTLRWTSVRRTANEIDQIELSVFSENVEACMREPEQDSIVTGAPMAPARPWALYTPGRRRVFLLVMFLLGTSNYVDKNIVGVVLEQIKAEFRVSDTMLGLLSGIAFAVVYATLGVPVARLADRANRKVIMTVALFTWSAMTVLCGAAGNFWQLAAARFGVGAGEAGSIPPAQSLLADYYPPSERARAIGIFMMSATAGYVLVLTLGGWLAQNYGWRATFFVIGVLSAGLAPLTYLVLDEPRNVIRPAERSTEGEPLRVAIRTLAAKSAYRNILAGIVAYFFVAYGAMIFIVSFMMRVHEVTIAQAGFTYGAITAVGGVVGNLGGGAFADRCAKRDIANVARLAGWGMLAAIPFYEFALAAPSMFSLSVGLLLSTTLISAAIPPMLAALHLVCGSKRRASAVALVFFFANLIGLGLGPVITGFLSDHFSMYYGPAAGLRFALSIVTIVFVPAGWFLLRAARSLRADEED